MPLVLSAMAQQIAVQLFDVVFIGWNVLPGMKNRFHRLGITGNFLLIAGSKAFYVKVSKQVLDFAVSQFAAFNPGGRADAFDSGNPAQRIQSLWRKRPKRAPCALEFIDFGE